MIGKKLAHYEITGKLGAGGMGEVYLARDTTLGRDVAVKLLPPDFATDPDRLARFRREAALLASLNHPNIATLHGLEKDGESSFIVMEHVPGEDLATRLSGGTALSVDEALSICTQIARSLAAAHDKGIIHRDLKPANIRVTPEDIVKVLDFGLAKAFGADAGASDLSKSPTIVSADRTAAGVILGTAGYMSPEQARGKPLDTRTDVWSFGCVLYECLTGHTTFDGETVTDVLAKILEREPEWHRLPENTPPAVRTILRRCLEKDPRKRWRDFNDIAVLLDEAAAPVAADPASEPGDRGSAHAPSTKRIWALALGLTVIVGAAAYFIGASRGSGGSSPATSTAPASAGTLPALSFMALTLQSGLELDPSFSPDGNFIVYTAGTNTGSDIYLQRIGGQKSINLTADSPVADYSPVFSPDGERVAFRSQRGGGGIFVMGSTGESVRRVSDSGHDPAWSPDGKQLIVCDEHTANPHGRNTVSALWIVDVDTGDKRQIFEGDAVQPAWSPNGHRIAYWRVDESSGGTRDIFTLNIDGTGVVPVTEDDAVDWNPVWSPDGRHLYYASDRSGSMNLWRISINEESGEVLGAPEQLTAPSAIVGRFDLSADGQRLAYESIRPDNRIERIAFDPKSETTEPPITILQSSLIAVEPAVSPDGRSIVFRSGGTQEDLYVMGSNGANLRKLTDDRYKDRGPSWSPDGGSIYFYSDRSGRYDIHRIRADGSGLERVTLSTGRSLWFPIISRDGIRMAGVNERGTSILDLTDSLPLAVENETVRTPDLPDGGEFWPYDWSPDDTRILGRAFSATQANVTGIYIYDVAKRAYQVFNKELREIAGASWLPDGRRIVVLTQDALIVIDTESGESRTVSSQIGTGLVFGSMPRDGSAIYYLSTNTQSDNLAGDDLGGAMIGEEIETPLPKKTGRDMETRASCSRAGEPGCR